MRDQTITKSLVDGLAVTGKEYAVWDAKLPGFGVRVRPTGAKTFIVVYRAGSGRRAPFRRYTIGAVGKIAPDAARIRAKQILGAVAHGKDPAADRREERNTKTVGELADLFLTEHVGKKLKTSTADFYRMLVDNVIKPAVGTIKADRLQRPAVQKMHSDLASHAVTANRALALLSSVYNFASGLGEIPEGLNPARRVARFKETARERFLGIEELERLGQAIREAETIGLEWDVDETSPKAKHIPKAVRTTKVSKSAAAAIRLLILTGCRLGEILTLKWEYVDFNRAALFLPDSKTGKKTVILNAPALAVLSGLDRVGPYVIPGDNIEKPRSDLKRPWAAILKRAGLSAVRLHDLRHTYASFGAGSGLGLPIVGKLLGHSQPSTTARYAHLDNDPLRKAAERIGAELATALGENFSHGAEVVSLVDASNVPRKNRA